MHKRFQVCVLVGGTYIRPVVSLYIDTFLHDDVLRFVGLFFSFCFVCMFVFNLFHVFDTAFINHIVCISYALIVRCIVHISVYSMSF